MHRLESLLGYEFKNKSLLVQALSHKSHVHESGPVPAAHNERLEFLGDAVVDLALSEILTKTFPEDTEGALSKKRASLVNEAILARVAQNLALQDEIFLGKGELSSGGQKKPRILASAYEALVGAVFLDSGYEAALEMVNKHFVELLPAVAEQEAGADDFKTRLQEQVQALLKTTPSYSLLSESGPPHERIFSVQVQVNGRPVAQADGRSKKQAEQEAARIALNLWREAVR